MFSLSLTRGLIVATLVIAPFTAGAQELFIDATNGNDSNNCTTESTPCQTFTALESIVQPGDDIAVTGTFTSTVALNNAFRGTSTDQMLIEAWSGNTAPRITVTSGTAGLSVTGDYVTIDGFTIEGTTSVTAGLSTSASNVVVQNNTVKGALTSVSIGGTNNRVTQNTVGGGLVAIGITGEQHTVTQNDVTCSDGLQCNIGINISNVTSGIIANNHIFGLTEAISESLNAAGVSITSSSSDILLAQNTFYNNDVAVSVGVASTLIIKNNILSMLDSQHGYAYLSSNDSFLDTSSIDYNNYHLGGAGSDVAFIDSGVTTISTLAEWRTATNKDTNGLSVDPLFDSTDETQTTYLNLTSTSPCIDAGEDLSGSITVDYYGNERPAADAYDMGAHEFGATGAAPEAPTNVTVSPIKQRRATVNWDAPSGSVSYYELQYSVSPTFETVTKVSDIITLSSELTGLKSNKKYYVRVRSVVESDTTEASDYSETASFLTKPAPPKKVLPSTGAQVSLMESGKVLLVMQMKLRPKKNHIRKKLKAVITLKNKKGKKVLLKKVGKTFKKKVQVKVKKKGARQRVRLIIQPTTAEKRLQWNVRFKRNVNKKSPIKKSKRFIPAASL